MIEYSLDFYMIALNMAPNIIVGNVIMIDS